MKSECVNNVSWWKQPALKLNLKARRAGGILHPLLLSPLWQMSLLGTPALSNSQWRAVLLRNEGRTSSRGTPCSSRPFKVAMPVFPPPTPTAKKKNHEEWAVLSCKSQGLVYSTCTDALNLPMLNVLTIHRWSRPAMYCERDTWPLIKIFNNCSSQNWQKFKVTSFFNNGIYFFSA